MPRCFPNAEIRNRSLWYFCMLEGSGRAEAEQVEACRAYIVSHRRALLGDANQENLLLRYMRREHLAEERELQERFGAENLSQITLPEFDEEENMK